MAHARGGGTRRSAGNGAAEARTAARERPAIGLVARARRAGRRALNLYLDASALVKRYVAEPGSELVREAMAHADGWFTCRVAYVETARAVGLAASRAAAAVVTREWPAFGVVELDQRLAEEAAALAVTHELRSLDSLHLASALLLARDDVVVATWDRRLHAAATAEALALLPDRLD